MRSDSTEYEVANRKIFTECCGTIENLSENQEYHFRVKAVNEVGEGDPSKPISAKIQDDESMYKSHKRLIKNFETSFADFFVCFWPQLLQLFQF